MNRATTGFLCANVGSDYTDEERVFLVAIDAYKHRQQRPFPTWREVLAVLKSLGYRQVEPAAPLPTLHEVMNPGG